jgi:hypothetical protein
MPAASLSTHVCNPTMKDRFARFAAGLERTQRVARTSGGDGSALWETKGESRPAPVRCPLPLVDQPAEDRRDLPVEHLTVLLEESRNLLQHSSARPTLSAARSVRASG